MKLKSVFYNRMKELLNAHMEDPAFDRAAFISAEEATRACDRYGMKADPDEATRQMDQCLIRHGLRYDEFGLYHCINKPDSYRKTFVTEFDRRIYAEFFNTEKMREFFKSYASVYGFFKPYFQRNMVWVASAADFDKFSAFVASNARFLVKQRNAAGKSETRLTETNAETDLRALFDGLLAAGSFRCETPLSQDPAMASLFADAVSKAQVVTVRTGDRVHLIAACLVMNKKATGVVNSTVGGIYCAVDPASGQVTTDGYDLFGKSFLKHPVSGASLKGFALPRWQSCLETVEAAARKSYGLRYAAWHMALDAEKGWVLVDVKADPAWKPFQMADKVGKKPAIEKIIRDYPRSFPDKSVGTEKELLDELLEHNEKPLYRRIKQFIFAEPREFCDRFGVPEAERKKTIRELKRSLWLYGLYYDEFFLFGCRGRSFVYKRSFIPESDKLKIGYLFNSEAAVGLCRDKAQAYEYFKEFYKRDALLCENEEDLNAFLAFTEKHRRFIRKMVDGGGGVGAQIFDVASPREAADVFAAQIQKGRFLCEELIRQDPSMAAFNPTSVNTVRVATVQTKKGVVVFAPFFRSGRMGSIVDNGSAGGVICLVNAENGVILTDGFDEKGNRYEKHPDSGVQLRGRQICAWDDCVRFAKLAAEKNPELRCAGWDMALSDKGWVVVEVNGYQQWVAQQMCDKKGKKAELKRLLKQKTGSN